MEAFAAEGTKELLSTFRIGALNAGDSLRVIATAEEVLDHLRNALQTEASVGRSILLLVVVCEMLEVLFENGLKHVRSPLTVRVGLGVGLIRAETKRKLCLHVET